MTEPIPSPPGLPIVGNFLEMREEAPIQVFERWADTYGPIYKYSAMGREIIVISSEELMKELIDETRFWKMAPPALNRRNGPPGLFGAPSETDPAWGVAHRVLIPAFSPTSITDMFDEMHDIASQLVLKWARLGSENMIVATEDFTRLTLDTIALCAMDYRFNSFYSDAQHPFVEAMRKTLGATNLNVSASTLLHRFIGMKSREDHERAEASQLMRAISKSIVTNRRENPKDKKDLLNAMVNGVDPKTGERMSDELIMSNMTTFLIAGHETTSGLLSFAFYYLLKNPESYRKAQDEVDSVIGTSKMEIRHIKDLKYINAVLRETIRLSPTAPAIFRVTRPENQEQFPTLGGGRYAIPKGQGVMALLTKIQRDPKVYGEDADEFKPERMVEDEFQKLSAGAWKPFGTGLRACIGRAFAWQEATIVMALLLQNFDFRLQDPNYELKIKQQLTIKPSNFRMYAKLRQGVTATSLQNRLISPPSSPVRSNFPGPLPVVGVNGESRKTKPFTVLYGSNTGTCQNFAQRLAAESRMHGFEAEIFDMDAAQGCLKEKAKNQPIVIITASYEGLPPDNAAFFTQWLENLPNGDTLHGVRYAVFGCGHSDWAQTFQRIPKLVDDKLAASGATRLAERGFSNAADGDMFGDFETWTEKTFWPAILAESSDKDQTKSESQQMTSLKLEISTQDRATSLRHDVRAAEVTKVHTLTAPNEPLKKHLEVMLPTDMVYQNGDYLAILPLNPEEVVQRVMARFEIPWDAFVTITDPGLTSLPTSRPIEAFEMLRGYVELSQPITKKDIEKCIAFVTNQSEKVALESLAGDEFQTSVAQKRMSLLDVAERFSSMQLPFEEFLSRLPPMRLRHYSISSSPLQDATKCTISYSVIDEEAYSGQGRFRGAATTYLSSLRRGDKVQVSVRSTNKFFRLPLDIENTPILMVCAGTGLAPFRGFLQERDVQISGGRKLAPALLFVGCRSQTEDRLYAEEIDKWAEKGVVDVRYAFSREPKMSGGCKYVQERMKNDKADVLDIWQKGAKVYICGSQRVATAVGDFTRDIVREVAAAKGRKVTEEQIDQWLAKRRNERFVTDVFT